MLLVYFDTKKEEYFYYLSGFDDSKFLGETNKFGDVLIGLFVFDFKHRLKAYRSSFQARLLTMIDYEEQKNRKEEP